MVPLKPGSKLPKRPSRKTTEATGDLAELANSTLSDVETSSLPDAPFAAGFDMGALASGSTRDSMPPAKEDTDGRIDLSLALEGPPAALAPEQSLPPPTISAIAAATATTPQGSVPPSTLPRLSQPGSAPMQSTADDALDAIIARQSMSPVQKLAALPVYVWIGLAVGVVGLLVVMMGGEGEADTDVVAATAVASAQPVTPTEATPLTAAAFANDNQPSATSKANKQRKRIKRKGGGGARTERPTEARAAEHGAPASIDSLLDQALGNGKAPGRRPVNKSAGSSLPKLPPKAAVAAALGKMLPEVRYCAGGKAGVAFAHIKAKSDGRITSVRVTGSPFSRTSAGRCMERVVRRARFPRFSASRFTVKYPYKI